MARTRYPVLCSMCSRWRNRNFPGLALSLLDINQAVLGAAAVAQDISEEEDELAIYWWESESEVGQLLILPPCVVFTVKTWKNVNFQPPCWRWSRTPRSRPRLTTWPGSSTATTVSPSTLLQWLQQLLLGFFVSDFLFRQIILDPCLNYCEALKGIIYRNTIVPPVVNT